MTRRRLIWTYALLVGLPLLGLFGILRAGQSLAPAPAASLPALPAAAVAAPLAPNLFLLVAQLAVILAVSSGVALLFGKIRQPKVIGEMFAGIMLGPSLLGWVAPEISALLFPPGSLVYLNVLSQVGVVIYMFLVGLALDTRELRHHGDAAILSSHASIVTPFLLGSALALFLYPRLSDGRSGFVGFALFVGAAMSITAFPVLARILTQRNMLGTRLGSLAITCAAVDDVTGWCILAYIVVVVRSHEGAVGSVSMTIGGLLVFVLLMVTAGKRLLSRFERAFQQGERLTENALALMILVVLVSAAITEHLGLHLLFGAFLAGAVMPKDKGFVRYVLDRFESTTVVLLLPLYFAYTGLRTSIYSLQSPALWLICGVIILTAIAGKLGGSLLVSRFTGSSWRDSFALGILLNTRGLMELVILNVGLDIGVISGPLFSMMVLMALVTTFMTAPLFEWVYPIGLIMKTGNGDAKSEKTALSEIA